MEFSLDDISFQIIVIFLRVKWIYLDHSKIFLELDI